jgi:hypothetical protein
MSRSAEWDDWYASYETAWAACLVALQSDSRPPPPEYPTEALACLARPSDEDLQWIGEALQNQERQRFVAELARAAPVLGEGLFRPLLDAAIDEIDPSDNRCRA